MTFFLFLVAAACVAVGVLAWRRRATPGAVSLLVLLAAVAEWNFTYGLEIAAASPEAKLLWAKVQYLGIVTAPVAVFAFAAEQTGRRSWLRARRLLVLALIPAATLVLAVTHELHHLVWSSVQSPGAGRPLRLEHGPAFWPGWVWAYLMLFSASVMLIAARLSARRYFRRQTLAVSVAVGAPWTANLAYVLGISPDALDTTTIAFAVTALALALACLRWQLLEFAPVARDAIVEHMRDAMMVLDHDGRVVDCNPAMHPLIVCAPDGAIGRRFEEVLPAELAAVCRAPVTGPDAAAPAVAVVTVERHDGPAAYEAELVALPAHGGRSGRLLLLHDVTARERLEAYLADQALTDELTHVGNRRCFLENAQRALIAAARHDEPVAVLFVDIDGFKQINDAHGHDFGDAILVAAARRLEESVRPHDTVARMGGDEFAVLLRRVGSEAAALEVRERVARALRRPVEVGGRSVPVAASVGVHVSQPDGETPESLLRDADRDMYAVKRGAVATAG